MASDKSGADKRRRRWPFFGWWIVLTGGLADVATSVSGPHVFGFFVIPMTTSLGMGRGLISAAYAVRIATEGGAAFAVGRLLDRYGPRMLMVLGGFLAGLLLMTTRLVQNFWQFALVCALFGLPAAACMGRIVPGVTVAKWFIKKRGRAIGLITTGMSLGIAIFSPISQALIESVGWRWTWVFLGGIMWFLLIPASLVFMRKTPESMGLKSDGDTGNEDNSRPGLKPAVESSWTLEQARRTSTFWFLSVAMVVGTGATSAISFHQVPAMLDNGFTARDAAGAMIVFGLVGILSKVVTGFLAERFSVQILVIVATLGSAASVVILMNANSLTMVYAYAFLAGLNRPATHPLSLIVWADYFGRGHQGTIQGTVYPFLLIARTGAPLIGGLLFDLSGNYQTAFLVVIGMHVLGALAMVFAPPPVLTETGGAKKMAKTNTSSKSD